MFYIHTENLNGKFDHTIHPNIHPLTFFCKRNSARRIFLNQNCGEVVVLYEEKIVSNLTKREM